MNRPPKPQRPPIQTFVIGSYLPFAVLVIGIFYLIVCALCSAADMLPERKDKSVLAPTLTHTEADAVLDCFGPWNPAVACGRRGR